MAKSKVVKANEKIAEKVVGGYKKVEEAVVGGYKKIEDAFVDRYLTHDGESVEDAKARIRAEQEKRQAQAQEYATEHVKRAQETAHVPGHKE